MAEKLHAILDPIKQALLDVIRQALAQGITVFANEDEENPWVALIQDEMVSLEGSEDADDARALDQLRLVDLAALAEIAAAKMRLGSVPTLELGLTDEEIVDAGERIARRLAECNGYDVESQFPMRDHDNPRSRMYWDQAVEVFDALNGTCLTSAADNVDA